MGLSLQTFFFFFSPLKAKVWISLKFSLLSPDTFLMLSILPASWTPLSMVLLWSEGLRVQGECHIALTAQTYLFHSLKTKEKDQTKMKGWRTNQVNDRKDHRTQNEGLDFSRTWIRELNIVSLPPFQQHQHRAGDFCFCTSLCWDVQSGLPTIWLHAACGRACFQPGPFWSTDSLPTSCFTTSC